MPFEENILAPLEVGNQIEVRCKRPQFCEPVYKSQLRHGVKVNSGMGLSIFKDVLEISLQIQMCLTNRRDFPHSTPFPW
jgi:hypothetical protein